MADIRTLFLFVHFVMPDDRGEREGYVRGWRELIEKEGPKRDAALCVLSCAPGREPEELTDLYGFAARVFGDRCVLDPCDESDATKVLLADDLLRTMRNRGRFAQWIPYEMWTSTMARRWTEGLRLELLRRGHRCDPANLRVVSCGQQWAGCLTKYSMLMPAYLGVERTPEVRVDLCTDAGWPLRGARFIERVALERHVSLYLFETAEGRPMGQFLDGLRPIWTPLHAARVQIAPAAVEVRTSSPNEHVAAQAAHPVGPHEVIADVGDGCQPRLTTLIGRKDGARVFRDALVSARVEPRPES